MLIYPHVSFEVAEKKYVNYLVYDYVKISANEWFVNISHFTQPIFSNNSSAIGIYRLSSSDGPLNWVISDSMHFDSFDTIKYTV